MLWIWSRRCFCCPSKTPMTPMKSLWRPLTCANLENRLTAQRRRSMRLSTSLGLLRDVNITRLSWLRILNLSRGLPSSSPSPQSTAPTTKSAPQCAKLLRRRLHFNVFKVLHLPRNLHLGEFALQGSTKYSTCHPALNRTPIR